ncbi:MAG: hypothetical protein ACHQ03_07905 [Candidatus Bathyarchaeia archaeon]
MSSKFGKVRHILASSRTKHIAFSLLLIGIFLLLASLPYVMVVARQFDFIPYSLRIAPGTNGDGTLADPPGILPNKTLPTSFLSWPMPLTTSVDLGWSGDRIVSLDRSKWTIVGVTDDTNDPAIVAANYTKGHIVYVTDQLAPQHQLVFNILAWYSNRSKPVRVALMIDSIEPTPEQRLDDWGDCFSDFAKLANESHVSLNVVYHQIRQYDLVDSELTTRNYDVLILAMGWGDGYFSRGRNWDMHNRDATIEKFVASGGILLLPEAGELDEYGFQLPNFQDYRIRGFVLPPSRALNDLFSNQTNSFLMAGISLSAIGVLLTTDMEKKKQEKETYRSASRWLFAAAALWFVVPLLDGLLREQTVVVLWALCADVIALVLLARSTRHG